MSVRYFKDNTRLISDHQNLHADILNGVRGDRCLSDVGSATNANTCSLHENTCFSYCYSDTYFKTIAISVKMGAQGVCTRGHKTHWYIYMIYAIIVNLASNLYAIEKKE